MNKPRCRARYYESWGWMTCTRRDGHTSGHKDRKAGEWWCLNDAMDALLRAGGVPLESREEYRQ